MKRAVIHVDPLKVREWQERSRPSAAQRRVIGPASPEQREKVRGEPCLSCGASPCDPAHLIDRSLCPEGADDARAVVALCRRCHAVFDAREMDLLPMLEVRYRVELAFAVERFGLVSTLERVTGAHWIPDEASFP